MPKKSLLVLTSQFGDVDGEPLGDGVRIIEISDAMLKQIYEQNNRQIANWDLFYGGYNHALVNDFDLSDKSLQEAEQEIVRAAIVLRIVQPYSSPVPGTPS
jgi:hypothetical protein